MILKNSCLSGNLRVEIISYLHSSKFLNADLAAGTSRRCGAVGYYFFRNRWKKLFKRLIPFAEAFTDC